MLVRRSLPSLLLRSQMTNQHHPPILRAMQLCLACAAQIKKGLDDPTHADLKVEEETLMADHFVETVYRCTTCGNTLVHSDNPDSGPQYWMPIRFL